MKNVLIISPRDPWPAHKGYALRTIDWLDALSGRANVTLVAPVHDRAKTTAHVVAPARSFAALARSALHATTTGLPLQSLLSAGYDWREAIARAEADAGPFDVAVVILSRTTPWVAPHLRASTRVLDAIDSLAVNARERGRASGLLSRGFWRVESGRMERLERAASSSFDRIIVVSDPERVAFSTGATVIPLGADVGIPDRPGTEWEFGFTGRLAYFANRKSVELLVDGIWPLIRREAPEARLLIAGADAPRSVASLNGRNGVTVISPFTDRRALLSRVRIALLPVTHGSGQSMKTIEAAEAGCAIVGTTAAFRGAELLKDVCVTRDDPAELARAAVAMLKGDAAEVIGSRAREIVVRHYGRESSHARLLQLVESTP